MDLVLDPWPIQPWQRGGTSNGNTAYRMPPIPGGTGIVFWMRMNVDPGESFMLDCRDGGAAYWYSQEGGANGCEPVRVRGAAQAAFGFFDIIGKSWVKVAIQAPGQKFANGFTLFARYTNQQFITGYDVGGIQVLNRPMTLAEISNPRGLGPTDAVAATYDFSDISGGLLKDVSGNGYHASIIGNTPIRFGF